MSISNVGVEEIVTEGSIPKVEVKEEPKVEVKEEPKVEPKVNLDDYIPKSKALNWKKEAKQNAKKLAEYEAKIQDIKNRVIERTYFIITGVNIRSCILSLGPLSFSDTLVIPGLIGNVAVSFLGQIDTSHLAETRLTRILVKIGQPEFVSQLIKIDVA